MTDTASPSNSFDASVQRFADASGVLEELRDKVAALSEFQEQQSHATSALNGSRAALHTAVEALSPVGELGTELLSSLKAVVAAAETAFDQGTVKGIRDDVAALSGEVESLRDSICAERDEARRELAEMRAKVQALPERIRSKHGLNKGS
jgi:ABC-type transporter Mla subunit MlaD